MQINLRLNCLCLGLSPGQGTGVRGEIPVLRFLSWDSPVSPRHRPSGCLGQFWCRLQLGLRDRDQGEVLGFSINQQPLAVVVEWAMLHLGRCWSLFVSQFSRVEGRQEKSALFQHFWPVGSLLKQAPDGKSWFRKPGAFQCRVACIHVSASEHWRPHLLAGLVFPKFGQLWGVDCLSCYFGKH